MKYEISQDGAFETTPEGDVVSAYEGVNDPLPTPRGDMPHYREDIAGTLPETPQPLIDHSRLQPPTNRRTPSLETRQRGIQGIDEARRILNGKN